MDPAGNMEKMGKKNLADLYKTYTQLSLHNEEFETQRDERPALFSINVK